MDDGVKDTIRLMTCATLIVLIREGISKICPRDRTSRIRGALILHGSSRT
jgi:hypothetical protein